MSELRALSEFGGVIVEYADKEKQHMKFHQNGWDLDNTLPLVAGNPCPNCNKTFSVDVGACARVYSFK